jgi:phage I-like protein
MPAASASSPRQDIAINACSFELRTGIGASTEIQLLPAGKFAAVDGRPGPGKKWKTDKNVAARLIAQLGARKNPLNIDYEHQSLNTEANGQPAPAAGWFKNIEWREPTAIDPVTKEPLNGGLFATDVQWTDRAREHINAGEYRYVSPVFASDKTTGEVTLLINAAITNTPGLDGMQSLADRYAMRIHLNDQEEPEMELKTLLAAVGLAENATEAEALSAIAALRSQAETAASQIDRLKAQAPDPSKYVDIAVMNGLKDQVNTLSSQLSERNKTDQQTEVAALVAQAQRDGKLLPAQEAWAKHLGEKDIAALREYVATAPGIAALTNTQTGGRTAEKSAEENSVDALTDEDKQIAERLGLSVEQLAATAV